MRDPLTHYFPGAIFWKFCPQLADVAPFRQLFEADATPSHEFSSNVMWWIVRVYHLTHRNDLREMIEEERQREVSDALFGDPKWHDKPKKRVDQLAELKGGWDRLKPIQLLSLETARRQFQGRNDYMGTLNYKEHQVQLDRMNGETPKRLKELEELELAYRMAMGELDEDEDPDGHALEEAWFSR
jgi:hypothetical protein